MFINISPMATIVNLPYEIVGLILQNLPSRGLLPSAMCINRTWYDVGHKLLYANVLLDFRLQLPNMDQCSATSPRAIRCLEALNAHCSAAKAVLHLSVTDLPTERIKSMVKSLLTKTAGLLSLNLQYAIDDNPEPLLSHDLCASVSFLPRLTAVNTNDNRLISTQGLASGRPLQYIRIQGFTSEKLYAQLKEPLHLSMKSILHLQLAFDVVSLDAAVQLLEVMVRDFQAVTHLGVQFRLPKPRLVTWEMYEDALDKMGPLIARLSSLKAFSLVTSPDPILSIAHEGRRHQLDSDRYEEETMKTARRFLNKHGLCLQRLELRWHGWKIDRGDWSSIPCLSRRGNSWFYADTNLTPGDRSWICS